MATADVATVVALVVAGPWVVLVFAILRGYEITVVFRRRHHGDDDD